MNRKLNEVGNYEPSLEFLSNALWGPDAVWHARGVATQLQSDRVCFGNIQVSKQILLLVDGRATRPGRYRFSVL